MHSAAAIGKRLSRTGGSEYAAPTASAATTAAVSSRPWVSASTIGMTAATATIRHAAGGDSSPARAAGAAC